MNMKNTERFTWMVFGALPALVLLAGCGGGRDNGWPDALPDEEEDRKSVV